MPADHVEDVAASLYLGLSLFVRQLRQRPLEGEPTAAERSVMARLDRSGPTSASDLARLERVSPQAMSVTVGTLERSQMVERRADPNDGRRSVLSLTPAGRRVLEAKRSARAKQVAAVLSGHFSDAELRTLAQAAPLIERLALCL